MNSELNIAPIALEKLLFDPENPRLPSKLRGYNKDSEVLDWMLIHENAIELMGSIGEKGYFPAEPLLVVPSKKRNGFFEVIEGNRRLAAVKLLNAPSLATFKKQSVKDVAAEAKVKTKAIPAINFSEKDEILIYLGYRHITGIKEWGPLAKAKYLSALGKSLKIRDKSEEFRTIAKIIGSSPGYVKNILNGLRAYNIIEENNFFDIEGLDEVSVEFGVLYTAIGRRNISTFVGIDLSDDSTSKKANVKHLKELTSWMFEKNSEGFTRLGESRNIQDLDKVVANSNALKYFRQGRSLAEAVLFTGKPLAVFYKGLFDSLSSLKIARDQFDFVEEPSSDMVTRLDEILASARNLRILINAKLDGQD